MSGSLPNTQVPNTTAKSQSTINNGKALAHSLQRLSISAATSTSLPDSPRSGSASPARILSQRNPTTNGQLPPRSPLHRSPSSMSQRSRSSTPTPTLLRKASMNSLHGVGGVTPSRSSPARRSSSAQFTNASTMVGKTPPLQEDTTPPPPKHTSESIATNHFKVELELHNKEESPTADTIVILHDACYGHRYSRPRTSKASLSTIVERPERIHASILGLSVAYVRLGERHAGGRHPLHPANDPASIPSIPFRIRKTTRQIPLSSQAVTNVHGVKWMEELKIMCDNAEARLAMNGKELARPEMNRGPDQGSPAKLHEGDLYLCSESLDAMEGALGAVCEGVDAVFQGAASGKGPHRAFVTIRPPGHHCSASYPSGFCWVNNVHVGISHAALTHGLTHAAIIDFDLHHGDGSQAIAWESNRRAASAPKNALPWKKTSIGYFSLHDINSYPCEMGDEEKVKNASLCIENAHGQSIWNVHLQPWKSEAEFWSLYEDKYSVLLEKTRIFLRAQTDRLRQNPNGPKPKGAIFLSAGFDASEWESSGMQRHKVNVPTEFYARLTRDVVELAVEEGTAVEGRVISVLEGGYSDRALCSGVLSHLSGMAAGEPIVLRKELSPNGLAYEMGQKIRTFDGQGSIEDTVTMGAQTYDPAWWSVSSLEQIDALVHPPPAAPEPRKQREVTPTFSSPTQSFIAKVTTPSARRSVSNMSSLGNSSPRSISRAPSPPPPEVGWTVAAHELSKLLIPIDRQTMSCRPEDLSAEATRARRDRQSILTPPTAAPESADSASQRMSLRTRKPTKTLVESIEEDEVKKPVSKTSRRKTVAGTAVIAADKAMSRSTTPKPEPSYALPTTQSNRRLSTASATSDTSYTSGHNRVSSNGTSNFQRPSTSQSTRPDSSISARGHSIPPVRPVVVKKTRAPAQPRAEVPKTSRVRRKSPLSESKPEAGQDSAMNPPSRSSSVVLPTTEPSSQNSDMDSLVSNMKKITLTLTTKAQREAREQAKKGAAAKPATSKATKPAKAIPKKESPPILPPSRSSSRSRPHTTMTETVNQPQLPPTPQPSIPTHLQQAPTSIPLPASSPPVSPRSTATRSPHQPPQSRLNLTPTASNPDVFIPYQPEGPAPQAQAAFNQEPLKWLPPNTSTPSPMKRADLPVFTSTSAIPFGVARKVNGGGDGDGAGSGAGSGARRENGVGNGDVAGAAGNATKQEAHTKEVDIWEIPDSPAVKRLGG